MDRLRVVLVFVMASMRISTTHAEIITYDAASFPETNGWSRETSHYFADRFLEDGWLIQQAEVVPKDSPFLDSNEDDIYRQAISEFSGVDSFFLEWRMITDGPRTGFGNVSPAAVVAGGSFGISYHFTIAEDQVRLIRDNLLPLVFVDIEPRVPHTYRLELFGTETYRFLIDGTLVDSGVPEGAYPTADSRIVFGGRAAIPGGVTTVRWDYIRYGTIPEPATGLLLLAGASAIIARRNRRTLQSRLLTL